MPATLARQLGHFLPGSRLGPICANFTPPAVASCQPLLRPLPSALTG